MGSEDVDWIHLAQDKDQQLVSLNTAMDQRVSQHFRKFLSS
jgi:hypothetical protein